MNHLSSKQESGLLGFIDSARISWSPRSGFSLDITGWLLYPVQAFESVHACIPGGERTLLRQSERPDVAENLPHVVHAARCGFEGSLRLEGQFVRPLVVQFFAKARGQNEVVLTMEVPAIGNCQAKLPDKLSRILYLTEGASRPRASLAAQRRQIAALASSGRSVTVLELCSGDAESFYGPCERLRAASTEHLAAIVSERASAYDLIWIARPGLARLVSKMRLPPLVTTVLAPPAFFHDSKADFGSRIGLFRELGVVFSPAQWADICSGIDYLVWDPGRRATVPEVLSELQYGATDTTARYMSFHSFISAAMGSEVELVP